LPSFCFIIAFDFFDFSLEALLVLNKCSNQLS